MDPVDTSHVGRAFFNASAILRSLFQLGLFDPQSTERLQEWLDCFPPVVLPGTERLDLYPMSMKRCSNRTGYKDFVGVFFPHVWRKMSNTRPSRPKKCRRLGNYVTAVNCLGHDLEVLLAFARTGEIQGGQSAILRTLGGPMRGWVALWPNVSTLVVMTTGSGRLLHPALSSHHARQATVVTYAGSTDWLEQADGYAFTDRLAGRLKAAPMASSCLPRKSEATGLVKYYYPNTWPHDVTMQYPSPYDSKRLWRGPNQRHILASFIGTPTHCSRIDLLGLWLKKNRTGFQVMETVEDKQIYSKILQTSRFCLVLDGHYPWTIRYLDVLQHGCVPVVVSESWHPPLHRLLAWASAAQGQGFPTLMVRPAWIPVLDQILANVEYRLW
ncbi:unnamed protein product, partial [Effrenium voratum]